MFLYLSMPSPRPLDGPHLSPASCVHSLASWRLSHTWPQTPYRATRLPVGSSPPQLPLRTPGHALNVLPRTSTWNTTSAQRRTSPVQKRVTRTSRVKEMPTKATQQRFHCRKVGSFIPKALVCFNHPVALGWVV